jgi:DNA replication and repair protein RecF
LIVNFGRGLNYLCFKTGLLILQRLKITQFKNYEQQSFEFSPRMNCLTGLNGMGKTNVLDAIHYLCLSRNHSGLPDKSLVRQGESFFRLEGHFEDPDGAPQKVVVKYQGPQKKVFERNDVPVTRLTDFVGHFPVVMIAPDDVSLVQEGSEERRRFLDATLSQMSAEYLQYLLTYNQLLKQRNALLKSFAQERRFDATLLEALDLQMLRPAAHIYAARTRLVEALAPLFSEAYAAISDSREQVSLAYDADQHTQDMAALLEQNRDKDRLLERTSAGPHRDDLELGMDGLPVRKFASQGQLKSYLLAMRLAQYALLRQEKQQAPLLLLDDIFDKLDEQRVRQLIQWLLGGAYGQIFITDTQRARMETIIHAFPGDYALFEIKNGKVDE